MAGVVILEYVLLRDRCDVCGVPCGGVMWRSQLLMEEVPHVSPPVSNAYSKVRGQLTASYTSAFNLVILGEFEGNLDSSVTQYFVVFNSKNYPQILSHFYLSYDVCDWLYILASVL